jgi:hypothetical protein
MGAAMGQAHGWQSGPTDEEQGERVGDDVKRYQERAVQIAIEESKS